MFKKSLLIALSVALLHSGAGPAFAAAQDQKETRRIAKVKSVQRHIPYSFSPRACFWLTYQAGMPGLRIKRAFRPCSAVRRAAAAEVHSGAAASTPTSRPDSSS